jgi:NAD(P)-dependent dehydrogenase (short-subunit alcohol dehydrogenase family)
VNCHGIAQWVLSEEMDKKDWRHMIDINLNGVFMMCQAVGKHMIKRGKGKIVNIVSMSGTIVNCPNHKLTITLQKLELSCLQKA